MVAAGALLCQAWALGTGHVTAADAAGAGPLSDARRSASPAEAAPGRTDRPRPSLPAPGALSPTALPLRPAGTATPPPALTPVAVADGTPTGGWRRAAVLVPIFAGLVLTGVAAYRHRGLPGGS